MRKGNTMCGSEKRGEKKCEKQPRELQGENRRRGRRCSRCWSRDSTAARGGSHAKQVDMSWRNCTHARSEGKCEEEAAAESSCCGLTATLFYIPKSRGKAEESGMKYWSWTWEKRGWVVGGRSCFNFCLCFSLSKPISLGNKLKQFSPSLFCPWQ